MAEYDDIDWLYEVLYAGFNQKKIEDLFIEQHKEILDLSLKIHDASCGNGIKAIALAKCGYTVSASDISEKMIQITSDNAKKENVNMNTFVASWEELPNKKNKYDLIFCCGNSISHSLSKKERINNVQSLKRCLNPGGILVLDTRNWEKMKNIVYTIYEERQYKGKKYLPIYIWSINGNNDYSTLTILFVESDGIKLNTIEKKLKFMPFSHNDIVQEVKDIGFDIIKDTYYNQKHEYCMYLREDK